MLKLLFPLVQVVSFFLLVAYVYCKSPAYRLRRSEALTPGQKLTLFLFFALISMVGTYLGVRVHGAIANARAIGPVLAGLIGGPVLGTAVGVVSHCGYLLAWTLVGLALAVVTHRRRLVV